MRNQKKGFFLDRIGFGGVVPQKIIVFDHIK